MNENQATDVGTIHPKEKPSISTLGMESNLHDNLRPEYEHESQVVPGSAQHPATFFGDQQLGSFLDANSPDTTHNDNRKRVHDSNLEAEEELAKKIKAQITHEFDDSTTMLYESFAYSYWI